MIELAKDAKAKTKAQQIREYVAAHPNATPTQIAEAMGVNRQYIYTVMYKVKAKALRLPKKVHRKVHSKVPKKLGRPRKVTEASENLKRLVDEYKQARAMKKDGDWKLLESASSGIPVYEDSVLHVTPKRMAEIAFEAGKKPKIRMEGNRGDPVNHPAHYKVGGIETIDFIEAKKLGYNLGNVVKYITRSDHKGNRKQDLEKALWYLNRELSAMS